MSLDRAIKQGREHRGPYRDSRAFDTSCRSHGDCPYCAKRRTRYLRIVRAENRALRQGKVW